MQASQAETDTTTRTASTSRPTTHRRRSHASTVGDIEGSQGAPPVSPSLSRRQLTIQLPSSASARRKRVVRARKSVRAASPTEDDQHRPCWRKYEGRKRPWHDDGLNGQPSTLWLICDYFEADPDNWKRFRGAYGDGTRPMQIANEVVDYLKLHYGPVKRTPKDVKEHLDRMVRTKYIPARDLDRRSGCGEGYVWWRERGRKVRVEDVDGESDAVHALHGVQTTLTAAELEKTCPLYLRWKEIIGELKVTHETCLVDTTATDTSQAGVDDAVAAIGRPSVFNGDSDSNEDDVDVLLDINDPAASWAPSLAAETPQQVVMRIRGQTRKFLAQTCR